MRKSTIGLALIASLFIGACSNNNKADNSALEKTPESIGIIGKTATITFPAFQVDETFVSDTVLHWKIVGEKGAITEGDEKVSFKKINDHQFFINWIEKTGLTVSQVVDPTKETVVSFISREDSQSASGKRAANFLEGTFKIKNQ
jgi:hypothetical protein